MRSLRCVLPFNAGIYCGKDIPKRKMKSKVGKRGSKPHTVTLKSTAKWRKQSKRGRLKASDAKNKKERMRAKASECTRIFESDIFRFGDYFSLISHWTNGIFQMFRCITSLCPLLTHPLLCVHNKHGLSHLNSPDCIVRHLPFSGRKKFLIHIRPNNIYLPLCAKTLNNVQSLLVCTEA